MHSLKEKRFISRWAKAELEFRASVNEFNFAVNKRGERCKTILFFGLTFIVVGAGASQFVVSHNCYYYSACYVFQCAIS